MEENIEIFKYIISTNVCSRFPCISQFSIESVFSGYSSFLFLDIILHINWRHSKYWDDVVSDILFYRKLLGFENDYIINFIQVES